MIALATKKPGAKPTAESEEICTYLDWDSRFFEKRIARVKPNRLDDEGMEKVMAWCQKNRIDCLYFLADSDHAESAWLAEKNGFLQADERLTFERPITPDDLSIRPAANVRLAREEEIGLLRAVAHRGHRDTRFYYDPHFDRSKCDLLYETWIENSFHGFAQAVLVAESNGQAIAYLTCHLRADESQIGLIGVSEHQQGAGHGTRMVQQFLTWSAHQGSRRATVVTQGRNARAQGLYKRNGFALATTEFWYHRWFFD